MPWIILGAGSLLITGMSFVKDIMQETQQVDDDISNVMLTTTLLIIAGAGAYLIATNKVKFQIK